MSGEMDGAAGLVTGAAGGIGRATAVALGRAGAAVVVADLEARLDDGEETVRLVREAGGEATFVAADVSRAADNQVLVEICRETFGSLDFAHNNAGIEAQAPLVETSEEDWDRIMAVNLKGVWLGLKVQIPAMATAGGGSIVNTSSLAGLAGAPGLAAYAAAKHGVVGLTRTAAIEAAPQGIRVNAVCPAAIATAMMVELPPARQQELAAPQAIKRFGRPDEVADAVVWLCSERSSFVTGAAIPVDAGATAGIVPPGEIG